MIDFDLQSYEKRVAPTGKYLVRVMGIPQLKVAKSNNGQYLEINFRVVDGPMSGHLLSKIFNIYNSSAIAERMAREKFLSFCKAVGCPQIKSYAQLDGCLAWANVSETSYNETAKNEVDSFEKFEGTPPVVPVDVASVPAVLENKFDDAIPF